MKKITIKGLLLLSIMAVSAMSYAQTGPGGVEKNDGTSRLQVWLKSTGMWNASNVPASNGEVVDSWQDASGYGNHGVTNDTDQNTNGVPLNEVTAVFNGYPALEFTGGYPGSDGYVIQDITDDPNAATVFVVLSAGDFVNNVGVMVAYNNGNVGSTTPATKSIGIWVQGDRDLWGRVIQSNGTYSSFSSTTTANLVSDVPTIVAVHADGTATLSQYANGVLANAQVAYDGTIQEYVDLLIGRQADEEFDGLIAEVIVYNKALNDAERIIVDNYLAAKFGINDLTNDNYVFQGTHGSGVAGIGQSGADTHISAYSDGMLGIHTPSALVDGDWLLFGHDGGDATTWVTTEQINGDTNLERIAREWRFDVTNTPGTVTMSIDPTDLPAFNTDFGFYTLWVDDDGDFTSGATAYPLTLVGGKYEATGVTITDGMFATIAAYKPEINFAQSTFSGFETVSPAVFSATIDYAVSSIVTVDYTVSGTSTENLPAAGTFSIAIGNTSDAVNATITNGDGFEPDETIILSLTAASQSHGVIGTTNTSTYTVFNSDGAANSVGFDAPFSYTNKKTITISKSMVSGATDLTDFSVLIRISGADLIEVESNLQSANGFDLRFTSENSVVWLEHQMESYVAGSEYLAWVKVPTLSATVDTKLEMYYGNSTVSTDPSVNTVFGAAWEAVYHLENTNDGSDNGNNFSLNGNATYATGYIGNGLTLDGTGDYTAAPSTPSVILASGDGITLSAWYRGTDSQGEIVSRMRDSSAPSYRGYSLRIYAGELSLLLIDTWSASGMRVSSSASAVATDGNWHYLTATYDGSADASGVTIYIDGVATSTDAGQLTNNLSPGDNLDAVLPLHIGTRAGTLNYLNGLVDETRVVRAELSADWIKTEYDNMTDAGTLITMAAATATSGFQIAEATDNINLTVALAAVDANDVSIDYAITSSTATNGADFTLASGTATITNGNLSTTILVDLTDDAIDEVDETFTLTLSNPVSTSNVSLTANNEIQITLLDDDAGPVISAADTLISINEGSSINSFTVNLSAASGTSVSIDYTVANGTATEGSDFILSSGTLTFPVDSTSASVSFNVVDDSEVETKEKFTVTLSNPVNGSLDLAYDVIEISINDNDNFGIDGPGGVGNADGSGTLVMWMVGDSAVATGGNVTSWVNEVGISELNMTPPNTSPILIDNARNGHKEISFSNVNDALSTSLLSASYFPYNEASTFTVTRHDNLVQQSNTYGTSTVPGGGLATNRFSSHMPWNGSVYFDIGQCCGTDGRSQFVYDNAWVGEYSIFSYVAGSAEGKTVRRNATQQDYDAGTDTFIDHTSYYFNLGQTQTNNYQGDILEYIMFVSPLNTAQQIIMENYLAAKYDIALDNNDYFSFKTTHSVDVAGIGQADASNFHTAAKSDFMTISNGSTIGDGDYVFIGHDNTAKNTWTTTDVPSDLSNIQRLEREWRVDFTGTPGTVSLAIDATNLPAFPANYSEYVLMTDEDGLFATDATLYPVALVDGEYVANDVVITQGMYFTIGTHIRTIEFVGTANQDFENVNNTISLSLSLAAKTDISVSYAITGSATPGDDFTLSASGSFVIQAGQTSKIIDLGIQNEAVEENDETIIVTISGAPSGYTLGSNTVFTYTINDDDKIRSVNFDHFKYSRQVTINGAQVTGSHTDFPVMITYTHNDLRTTANGGFVENDLGYDIMFYDSLNSTWLDHQLEYFVATTGEMVAWVNIPSLSNGTDVTLTMFYGNTGITLDQSSSATWNSAYQGVWHMGSGDFSDGSANGTDGVNQGSSDVQGQAGRAASFDGLSNIKISDVSNLSFGVADSYTLSAWYKGTDVSNTIVGLIDDNTGGGQGYGLYISSGNYAIGWQGNDGGTKNYIRGSAGGAINDDVWYHVVVTYDGTNGIVYKNGVNAMGGEDGTLTGTLSPNVSFSIGSSSRGAAISNAITGSIDEVRITNTVLTADWIATEHNNMANPGTFVTISGTQDTNTALTLAEDIGQVTVYVRVDPIDNTQATTVNFIDAATGTGLITEDFTLTPATVTIPMGTQTGSFTFNIINDLIDETDETIDLKINTPSSNTKLGTVSAQSYTITDDDNGPVISFIDATSTANEGSSLVPITVELNIASGNDVSVDYAVTGGDAVAGTDYVALSGTLIISAGDLSKTISFQPIDDAIIEAPETVIITLSNPVNGSVDGAKNTHTVTIKDNDDLGFEGPGGVGDVANTGGENLLKLWLIADSVQFSGTSVIRWDNIIQNISVDYDMVPVGTAPEVVDAAVNGHKEISFNNVSDALVTEGALSAVSTPGNELSIFIVTETDNLAQSSYAYATDNNVGGAVIANSISGAIPSGNNVTFDLAGTTTTLAYPTGWVGNHSIFTHVVSSDTVLLYRNNKKVANANPGANAFTGQTGYNLYLGKDGASGFFQGDIAEMIMFSREVNLAQTMIINNYLAAKYNLALDSLDLYNYQVSHGTHVAGIGRVNILNQHVAARAGIVTVSNASTLTDNEFVLFGHDNADISVWSSAEVPAVGIERTQREWRFDLTGTPGTVSIAIDTTLLPTKTLGTEDYIVLLDSDGDFSDGATVLSTVLVDGQYKASNVALTSGDYITFGIVSRTISFATATATGKENVVANTAVTLSLASSETLTLDYTVTGGTATGANDDYALAASGTVTFNAGQTSVNIPLGIINDSNLESDETIIITLSNPPTGVSLGTAVHTYTIQDEDNGRKIHFAAVSSTVLESADVVTVTIELEDPAFVDGTNETIAYLSVTGGTAEESPAPDFTYTADTVRILATQTTATFDITILDDVLAEANETIELSLSSPKNANLGTNTTYTYTITDNETAVSVEFQDATTTIDEGGSIAQIVVVLSSPSGQDVTVDYIAADVTATGNGTDYALAQGTLTIPAGDQIKSINVSLTDDNIEESAETFTITLSNPSGATIGGQTVHTVTLVDNDSEYGYYGPGGVGDRESNILWLDAENINGKGVTGPLDGATVTTWKDRSGNGYDFTATGTASTLDSTIVNGNGAVAITNSTAGYRAPVNFSNALSNYTFISVVEQTAGQYLVQNNTASSGDFSLNQNTNGLYNLGGVDYLPGNSSTGQNIMTWVFDAEAASTAIVRRDGAALASDANFAVMPLDADFSVGNQFAGSATSDFSGNVSEFIVFKKPLNTAQQNIVENYLSTKYGIAVTTDLYAYDGTHGFDLIGIGQEVDGQHLQSMSDSLLIISGPSTLIDGGYVMTGHDNANKTVFTTTESPNNGSSIRRIAREWRTDITGTPGTIIIKIDTTQLPIPPNGYEQYVVWTDADGDFRSGATTYQMEYSPVFGFHVTDPVTVADGTFIAIGVGQTVVEFELAAANGLESVTNPPVKVQLNFTMSEDVTINYAANGGTALGNNVDYLLTSGTLTIPAGQISANIIPGIIDDNELESDETIVITLTTPSSNVSLGSTSAHTYTINDNDNARKIQFSTPVTDTQDESVATKTVTVEINSASNTATTVDLNVVAVGNAATLTDDFTLSTTTVTIPGDNVTTTATFDITIVDDGIYENSEVITLSLGNPTNSGLDVNTTYTYNITDNDTQPVVAFDVATSFASEGSGTATIIVSLDAASVNDITVDYLLKVADEGTAIEGVDYTLSTGTLLILAGDTEESILVNIVDDITTEAAETINIVIQNPNNATLGAIQNHTLTVTDNDADGGTGPGGVGTSTNNLLWLTGDNYDGTTWTDKSGNSNNLSGGTPPAAPSANVNFNNQQTVAFTGGNFLDINTLSSTASDFDIFIVLRSDGTTTDQILFHADDLDLGFENVNGAFTDQNNVWVGSEVQATGTSILQFNLEAGTNQAGVSINGGALTTATYTPSAIAGTRTFGASLAGANGFAGDIAEVVIYNKVLNAAQRIILLNAFAAKNGINLGGNSRYAFADGTGANVFYYDLIGMGNEGGEIHVEATSQDYITIKNPGSLADQDYLLLANDGGNDVLWTTTGSPNASTRIIARKWRVDKTNDLGAITLQMDTTSLTTPPENDLTWTLLVDADGDFTAGAVSHPLTTVSGDIVGVDALNFTDGDFFTFALVKFETTGSSTDFNDPTAWTTGEAPSSGTSATIATGHDMVLSADITIGSLTIDNASSLDLNGFTLNFAGDCITLNGTGVVTVATAGSTIGYTNPNVVNQCVTGGMTYNNLYTNGASGSVKYLTGDIVVTGDLNLQSAAGLAASFDVRDDGTVNDYNITIGGNWNNDITFLPRSGTVTFNGTADQSITATGGETYNNLTINKASGILNLSSGVTTNGILTLTSGNIGLGLNDMNISSTGSISGGDASAYMEADGVGVVRHAVTALATPLTFPIGDVNAYSPFTFTLQVGTLSSSNVTINLRNTKHTNITEDNYTNRYWTLSNEGITGTLDYDVSYIYPQADVVGVESLFKSRKYSVSGDAIGGTVNTGTNELAYTGHTSFSDFLGESAPIPQPVELLSFDGTLTELGILLSWTTASELNNDYFEIQRSVDGVDFEFIGEIAGNGTINEKMNYSFLDDQPSYGISYYRLVQVDYDGTTVIYHPITVDNDQFRSGIEAVLYPNPTDAYNVNVKIFSGDENAKVQLTIFDLMGRIVHSELLDANLGEADYALRINTKMESGIYQVVIQQGNNQQVQRLLIK